MTFSKNKSIVYIIPSLNVGGTEKHLLYLARSMSNEYNVEVICLEQKGLLFPNISEKIKITNLGNNRLKYNLFKYIFLIYKLWKILKTKESIFHFFLPKSYLIAGTICILQKKSKLIMSRRSTNYYQKKYPFVKFWEKFLHRKMKYILVNSNNLRDQLIFDEGVDKNKIIEIKNGVKILKFKSKNKNQAESKYKTKEGFSKNNIIICLANLIPYKGHVHLIRSLSILNKTFKKWELLIIGDGDKKYKLQLENLVKKFNLQEKITFKGIQIFPEKFLLSAKLGILLSDHEGSSNAIIEYMNCSLPVISTDSGNVSQILDNKVNGYIVEQKDYYGIANLIKKILKENSTSKKIGENNKKKVQRMFNYNSMISKYKNIYEEI